MRLTFILAFASVFTAAQSQITITTNHLPDAGDTILTRSAIFIDDVDLEETGANHTWTFNFDRLQPLNLNPGITCYNVNSIPFLFQFMFNNPFDPAHNSDYGIGVEQADLFTISFEDAYMFYQNSNTKYTITGMAASINGLPLAAQMNAPDLLYRLPLTYDSSDSSHSVMNFEVPQLGYYGLDQIRHYHCDGWGTLNIWDQSFQVLRVRSVINATDSVFTSLINIGIKLPRPETITYEWISTQHIEPILKVTTTGGFVTQIQTADIYQEKVSVVELQSPAIVIYPNPADNELRMTGIVSPTSLVEIFDMNGKKVSSQNAARNQSLIDVSKLNTGAYTILIRDGNTVLLNQSFIKK